MKNMDPYQMVKKLIEERDHALATVETQQVLIDKLTAKLKEQGWIPCSERLPEAEGKYLTCDGKGNIHVMYHHNSLRYPFGIDENHSQYYPPVAWGHLPKAYKDGE